MGISLFLPFVESFGELEGGVKAFFNIYIYSFFLFFSSFPLLVLKQK